MAIEKRTKNVFIAVIIIIIVALGIFWYLKGSGVPLTGDRSFSGVEVVVPGTNGLRVTLDEVSPNPENDYPIGRYDNGPSERGSVVILDDVTATLSDGRVLTVFAHNAGGSGEFFYLVMFDKDLEYLAAYPIGDRVDIDDITVDGATVTVSYKTHGEGQAMVETPNTPATLTVEATGSILVKRITD